MRVALVAKRIISTTLDLVLENLKPMLLSVDNFFNSFQLTDQCFLRNISVIGILRADRMKEAIISSKKDVLKKDSGYFEVAHMSN